jgi:hypothetical protein
LVNARSNPYLTSAATTSRLTGGLNLTPGRMRMVSDLRSGEIFGMAVARSGTGRTESLGL